MTASDDRHQPADIDPALDQIRSDPNPELVHQHDEDRDPLDEAIIDEHESVDESGAGAPDTVAKERRLNPPPADEYD